MGILYEILSTPYAYLKKAFCSGEKPQRSCAPVVIPFGNHRQQHCVLWEPDAVTHEETVMYFHGGAYVFGSPESLDNLADAYNSQGYRFCSVGFRKVPGSRFPAQVDDAFAGIQAALSWLEEHGRPARRIVVGGTSAGGHLAYLVAYGRKLQQTYGFDGRRVAACISVAGIACGDDMLITPFPCYAAWRTCVNLPSENHSRSAMRKVAAGYSPINLVDEKSSVPLFIIHGRADKMSPYASQERFVRKLQQVAGVGMVHLLTLQSWKWQHMLLTVTLYKHRVRDFPPLQELFDWLDEALR